MIPDGMFPKISLRLIRLIEQAPPIHRQRLISCMHSLRADLWPSADKSGAFCLPTTDRKLYTTAPHKRVVETIHILIKMGPRMGRKRDEPDDKKEKTAAGQQQTLLCIRCNPAEVFILSF